MEFSSNSVFHDQIIIVSLPCDLSAKSKAGMILLVGGFFWCHLKLKRILEKVAVVIVQEEAFGSVVYRILTSLLQFVGR